MSPPSSAKSEELRQAALKRSLEQEQLDVTLPGRRLPLGRLHPDTQTLRELYSIFGEMGFQVFRSREVETDEYNFQLLNFQIGHPGPGYAGYLFRGGRRARR